MRLLDSLIEIFTKFRDEELFVSLDGSTFTYENFWANAAQLARQWQDGGLKKGSTVALLLDNGVGLPCSYLACAIGGYVACPILTSHHQEMVDTLLGIVKADLILKDMPKLDDSLSLGPEYFSLEGTADGPFMILFSSGSTGVPKAMSHSLSNIVGSALAFGRLTEMEAGRRLYHVLPMGYMAGILNAFFAPMVSGTTIVEGPLFSPETALRFWQRPLAEKVNVLSITPTIASALCRLTRKKDVIEQITATMKQVQCTSAPLPKSLQLQFQDKFKVAIQNCYGMTEIGGPLTFQTKDDALAGRDWSKPIDELLIDIRCEKEPGELWLKSPFMMRGYIADDGSLYNPFDEEGFMNTEDLAYSAEGKIQLAGRKKDIIIRGGLNISPGRLADLFSSLPFVADCAVLGMEHEFWGEEIVTCIVLTEDFKEEEATPSLNKHSREHLGIHERPDRFEYFHSLPRTAIGKLRKGELRETLLKRQEKK